MVQAEFQTFEGPYALLNGKSVRWVPGATVDP